MPVRCFRFARAGLASATLLLPYASLTVADAPPTQKVADVTPVRSVEGISEYMLENGLQVLLYPDPSKPTVTVNLTVFVGSRHEGYGESGMAHLLEHMLFKGTPDHPQVPKALQERGAAFNGTTWLDRTNYYETLPASEDNLAFAIGLEADRLINSFVRKSDLDSEMTVVRNEFERGENSPVRILMQRMTSTAYEWHNYGKSTIGNRADIERVPIENLKGFYKKYYAPDNAMLVIAGNFDADKALQLIRKDFAPIKNPDRVLPTTYTEEPAQDGDRVVSLRRVGDVPLAGTTYHIPPGSDPSYPAIDVLESVMTAQPAGRLYQALVETKRSASVSGSAYALHDPGILQFIAEVAPGNDAPDVLAAMVAVTEQVAEKPITQAEVDRAKTRLLKQWELASADTTRTAIELSEWAAMGDWRLYFIYRDRLEAVTAPMVNAAAETYLTRNNRTAGLFLPTEKPQSVPVPQPTENLAESIGDYQGRALATAGEAFEVTPQNIEARTNRGQLPTGVQTALLAKQTRADSVILRLTLRYGSLGTLGGRATAADLLPRLMMRGTETRTRQQIQDELDQLGARLTASGSPGVAVFAIQAKKETLPEVLAILNDVLRNATLPEAELDLIKQAEVASIEGQLSEPQSLATTAARRAIAPYPKGDPRYVPTLEENLARYKAVTRDDVLTLYEKFLGGTHGELASVGSFDEAATQAAVTKALANWKSAIAYERLPQEVPENLAGKSEAIKTPDKKNATYFAATVLPMTDSDPDYPALVMGNYILGGGALSSRLGDRVRQKEGLSYGVGSGFSAQSADKRATMYLYAITNPENMEKVKTAIQEELEKLIREGMTGEELSAAKQGYLQKQQVSWADDPTLTATLADTLEYNRTMNYYEELYAKIDALTPEQVVAALQKHIDPQKFVIVTAGDFKD